MGEEHSGVPGLTIERQIAQTLPFLVYTVWKFAFKFTLGLNATKVTKMSRAKLAFLFAASCLAVFGSVIVVPNANSAAVGNDTDSIPGSGDVRSQVLLGSGQFASVGGPILIDQLSFRAAPGTGPVNFSIATMNLFLSTSPKFPNTSGPLMSTTFSDNVGADNTLVFSGPLSFTSPGCTGPSVCLFDINVNFTTPFLYNPTQGRLLLDLKISGFSGLGGTLDAVSFTGPPNGSGGSIASVNGGLNDATGGLSFGDDIVQLRYTAAVPEPTTGALVFIGAGALAMIRRRRASRLARLA